MNYLHLPRSVRRLVVVLVTALAALTLSASPSNAEAVRAQTPGTAIRCDILSPSGVQVNGNTINFPLSVGCKWTNDDLPATDVKRITVSIRFLRNGVAYGNGKVCQDAAPFLPCPYSEPIAPGTFLALIVVRIDFNDRPSIGGTYLTPTPLVVP